MIVRKKTLGRAVDVEVCLTPKKPCDVVIIGYDPHTKDAKYFERQVRLDGHEKRCVNFPMPYSPNKLKILAYALREPIASRTNKSSEFFDMQIKTSFFDRNEFESLAKEERRLLNWIVWFSKNLGELPCKTYSDPYNLIKIDLVDKIYHESGNEHTTPCRIEVDGNRIEASKSKFRRTTVPGRIAFLLHEIAHRLINTNPYDEMEADLNAIDIFEQMGWSDIQFFYAFAKIFTDGASEDMERLYAMYNEFKSRQNEYKNRNQNIVEYGIAEN